MACRADVVYAVGSSYLPDSARGPALPFLGGVAGSLSRNELRKVLCSRDSFPGQAANGWALPVGLAGKGTSHARACALALLVRANELITVAKESLWSACRILSGPDAAALDNAVSARLRSLEELQLQIEAWSKGCQVRARDLGASSSKEMRAMRSVDPGWTLCAVAILLIRAGAAAEVICDSPGRLRHLKASHTMYAHALFLLESVLISCPSAARAPLAPSARDHALELASLVKVRMSKISCK